MSLPAPIVIVVCGHTVELLIPRRGDFVDWFRAGLGLDPQQTSVCEPPAGEALPEPERIAGAVVTGSPAMVTKGDDWSIATERWLARLHHDGTPILGVCYGHQLLARALGGEVDWNPRGREIGSVDVRLTDAAASDPLLEGLGRELTVQESHSQSVIRLPDEAVLLASNGIDPHQAYRVGSSSWGLQFHPEFDADIVRGYIAHRAEDLRAEGLDPEQLARDARDDPRGAAILARFGRLALDKRRGLRS